VTIHDVPHDDLLDAAIRESLGGRLASAAAAASAQAWTSSRSRRLAGVIASVWRVLSTPQRIRAIALMFAVGMIVHRAMARLGPAEPLGDLVPLFVLGVCALAAVFAEPIAREWERNRR